MQISKHFTDNVKIATKNTVVSLNSRICVTATKNLVVTPLLRYCENVFS